MKTVISFFMEVGGVFGTKTWIGNGPKNPGIAFGWHVKQRFLGLWEEKNLLNRKQHAIKVCIS